MTEERQGDLSLSEKIKVIDGWIDNVSRGEVKYVDPTFLREAFEKMGATFDLTEAERLSFEKYSNAGKAEGLRAVWGDARVDSYKNWATKFVEKYENETGKTLPALDKSGIKTSGMIQFFGELTSLALGTMSLEEFKEITSVRVKNGILWSEGRKDERVKVLARGLKDPILLSSIPPEFPTLAWQEMKSWQWPEEEE